MNKDDMYELVLKNGKMFIKDNKGNYLPRITYIDVSQDISTAHSGIVEVNVSFLAKISE